MKARVTKLSEIVARGSLAAEDYFWKTGTPSWRCANCGRANIYHDPKTTACPENPGDPNLRPKVK